MPKHPIDTNVIVRYLVGTPETLEKKFRGVFPFFAQVERGDLEVHLPEVVLFQVFFVLTSFYKVPRETVADKLAALLSFRGIWMPDKPVAQRCMQMLKEKNLDLVDAYLLAWCQEKGGGSVYSFDTDLRKGGLTLLPIE